LRHQGEGAEEEAGDVGKDGGAARGDAALLESEGEVPEVGVEVGRGFWGGEGLVEEGGEVGGVVEAHGGCGATCGAGEFLGLRGGLGQVVEAEGGMILGEMQVAVMAGLGAVLAEVVRVLRHGVEPFWRGGRGLGVSARSGWR
jgi:hypothetical protein